MPNSNWNFLDAESEARASEIRAFRYSQPSIAYLEQRIENDGENLADSLQVGIERMKTSNRAAELLANLTA
jgi:hypothetical protein